MASQTTSSYSDLTQPSWASLSGRVLEGGFELQEIVEADAAQARFKVRVLGDRDLDCVAIFFHVPAAVGEAQADLWNFTRQLRQPNISAPLGAGSFAIEDLPVTYVVVRRADESLDTVLGERALTVPEAGEALSSIAKALEALHVSGLAYGCLAPSRVLAVEDAIKLPSECVRLLGSEPGIRVFDPAYLAPESIGENISAASDIWCLGATLFESLTQKKWSEDSREETGDLPEPFGSIALRCLHLDADGRASLGEVMALYRGELKPVPRVRAAAAGANQTLILPQSAVATAQHTPASQEEELPPAEASVSRLPEEIIAPVASALHPESIETEAAEPETTVLKPTRLPLKEETRTPSWTPQATANVASAGVSDAGPSASEIGKTSKSPYLTRSQAGPSGDRREAPYRSKLDEALASPEIGGRRRALDSEEETEKGTSLWIWAGVALLVVLGLIWALRPKTSGTARTPGPVASAESGHQAAAPPAVVAGKTRPEGSAWQTRTLEPDGSASKAVAPVAKSPVAPTVRDQVPAKSEPAKALENRKHESGKSADIWRVVSYTYGHREDAERKAADINGKHGDLHAEAFSPSGGGPYLVVLGGRMSRDEAQQVKRKAVSAGLPRDCYIQNYKP